MGELVDHEYYKVLVVQFIKIVIVNFSWRYCYYLMFRFEFIYSYFKILIYCAELHGYYEPVILDNKLLCYFSYIIFKIYFLFGRMLSNSFTSFEWDIGTIDSVPITLYLVLHSSTMRIWTRGRKSLTDWFPIFWSTDSIIFLHFEDPVIVPKICC